MDIFKPDLRQNASVSSNDKTKYKRDKLLSFKKQPELFQNTTEHLILKSSVLQISCTNVKVSCLGFWTEDKCTLLLLKTILSLKEKVAAKT